MRLPVSNLRGHELQVKTCHGSDEVGGEGEES